MGAIMTQNKDDDFLNGRRAEPPAELGRHE